MRIFTSLLLGASLIGGGAMAQEADPEADTSALSGIAACVDIANPDERLACFDSAAGKLLQDEEEGRVVALDREAVREIERDAFGFNLPSISRFNLPNISNLVSGGGEDGDDVIGPVTEVTLEVESARRYAYKKYRFFMTNGQIWEMVRAETVRDPNRIDEVTIRPASLGSYFMDTGPGPDLRVRRIQ